MTLAPLVAILLIMTLAAEAALLAFALTRLSQTERALTRALGDIVTLQRSHTRHSEAQLEAQGVLRRIEERVQLLTERDLRSERESPRDYDKAQRLAIEGASAERLRTECGVSANEAKLLVKLHAPVDIEATLENMLSTYGGGSPEAQTPPGEQIAIA
ncbi:MAG: DUF2802 domain-containing protein [Pseudomonadota bacterium]